MPTPTPTPGPADSGVPPSASLNGCTDTSYQDASAPTATRTVQFGGGLGLAYSPKCLSIAAGQQVTFSGEFGLHPLTSGSAPGTPPGGATPNPIARPASGTTVTVNFPTAGDFPYFCGSHFGSGMYGVVRVK